MAIGAWCVFVASSVGYEPHRGVLSDAEAVAVYGAWAVISSLAVGGIALGVRGLVIGSARFLSFVAAFLCVPLALLGFIVFGFLVRPLS